MPDGYNDYLIIFSFLISFTGALMYIDYISSEEIFIEDSNLKFNKFKLFSFIRLLTIILVLLFPIFQMLNDFFNFILLKLVNNNLIYNRFISKLILFNFCEDNSNSNNSEANKSVIYNINDHKETRENNTQNIKIEESIKNEKTGNVSKISDNIQNDNDSNSVELENISHRNSSSSSLETIKFKNPSISRSSVETIKPSSNQYFNEDEIFSGSIYEPDETDCFFKFKNISKN
jgi:hypothetical protein